MNRVSSTVLALRIPIIIVTVAITAVLGFFAKDIRINPDIMGYLPKDDPVTVLNDYISETYGGSRLAVVALESENVFTRRTLETVDRLTDRFRLIEGVRYVTSLTNIIDIRKVDDWLEVGKLIDPARFPLGEQELQDLKSYTLGKEMYSGRLVSSDAKATVIVCKLEEGADETRVVTEIRQAVSDADPVDKVYFAGLPFQLGEISTLVVQDLFHLVPLTALLIIASLYVGRCVVTQALSRGHAVSVLETDTHRNRRTTYRLGDRVNVVFFGDIRDRVFVETAVVGQDAVIHLAAILPPVSERNPELCRSVNVGGTSNVLSAVRKADHDAAIVLVSSESVMGPTQDREPPLSTCRLMPAVRR